MTTTVEYKPIRWPQHLSAKGSRYYRTATLASAAAADVVSVSDRWTVDRSAHWLLTWGPLLVRCRWHQKMQPHIVTGRVDVWTEHSNSTRAQLLIVGFDAGEAYPFRVLTPFGSGFGQAGRVWISRDGLAKLLKSADEIAAPWL